MREDCCNETPSPAATRPPLPLGEGWGVGKLNELFWR